MTLQPVPVQEAPQSAHQPAQRKSPVPDNGANARPHSLKLSRVDAMQRKLPQRSYESVVNQDATHIQKDIWSFASLGVHQWLVSSLSTMEIKRPTGIQRACIPQILNGRDCIGGSKTGSGKTVAFAVPILQKWAVDPFGIFAVIMTPTR
jgi:ATP-dependent RNA helicase DDX49/DBP8